MELINHPRFDDIASLKEYTNELTKEMDEHVINNEFLDMCLGTYLCEKESGRNAISDEESESLYPNGIYAIRYPGATRGHIAVDENNCITEVILYDTACSSSVGAYKKSVNGIFDKYIGAKIVEPETLNVFKERYGTVVICGSGKTSDKMIFPEFIQKHPGIDSEIVGVDLGIGDSQTVFARLNNEVLHEITPAIEATENNAKISRGRKVIGTLFALSALMDAMNGSIGNKNAFSRDVFEDIIPKRTCVCSRLKDEYCTYYKRNCKGIHNCTKYHK